MTTEPKRGGVGELPPIERDESYGRTYIPLPGGWEIQTRGKGSSFRICDTKTGKRWNIERQPYIDEMLELMGREIHAACASPVKVESGEAVSDDDRYFLRQAGRILKDKPGLDALGDRLLKIEAALSTPQAENAELRKDAERWRYLRIRGLLGWSGVFGESRYLSSADAAIDAAIAASPG